MGGSGLRGAAAACQLEMDVVPDVARTWEVLDERVLELLESTHREDFVPVRYRKMAFTDMAIPLDHGETMMKPVVEGRLLQSLELKPDETVLEIGTGSGFITACLAQLAKHVVSVDIYEQFSKEVAATLKEKDIEAVGAKIVEKVQKATGGTLRG